MTDEHEEEHWELLVEAAGPGEAEALRGLLEAQGIPVWESQEGAGEAIGLTIGRLGRLEILVPASYLEQAQQVLDKMEEGGYENAELKVSPTEMDALVDEEFDDEDFEDDALDTYELEDNDLDDDDFDDDDLDDDDFDDDE